MGEVLLEIGYRGGGGGKSAWSAQSAGRSLAPGYSTLSAAQAADTATLNYGLFINHILHFLIVAAAIYFLVVRPVSRLQKPNEVEEEKAAEPTAEELLVEIRDLLAAQQS